MEDKDKTKEQLLKEIALLRKVNEVATTYLGVAGEIVVVIDDTGVVTFINKKGCKMLGYTREEVIGKNWFDTFLPDRQKNKVEGVSAKILSGKPESVEFFENLVLTKSGEEKKILWHNNVLKNDKGEIIAHISSGKDVTAKKK